MNTPNELIREAQGGLSGMIDHLDAIMQYGDLMALLMTAPDMEECAGLHRLILVVRDHAQAISSRHAQSSKALQRLANP